LKGFNEHDDGQEVDKGMVKHRAVILNVTQCNVIGHHHHVLPFISNLAERL
jgi:hypothetical protein